MDFLVEAWPYILDHAYVFLFLGMLLGGEAFLLPAAYMAAKGIFPVSVIIFLSLAATIISDTFWYSIGRTISLQKILSFRLFSKKRDFLSGILEIFRSHDKKLLYLSKFVYGTRTAVQILSGAIRMHFAEYSVVNIAGILSYILFIMVVAMLTEESIASLENILYYEYVSIGVFIIIITIAHICLKKWLGKKFTASSSRPGMKNVP